MWYTGIVILICLSEVKTVTTLDRIFLNSYKHCSHLESFKVTPEKGYLITPDVSPETETKAFRDCEVTLHSEREYGRICFVQDGEPSTIKDRNAELTVYDGVGEDGSEIFTLKYYPSLWRKREYCTNTPYLNLFMRRIDESVPVDVKELNLQFKVLDIESKNRMLFMEGSYCENDYPLVNSQVTVHNRMPASLSSETKLASECGLRFLKEGNQNKTMCLAYIPSSSSNDANCSTDWEMAVSTKQFSLDRKFFVYSLKCNEKRANEFHVWCSSPNASSFILLYQRHSVDAATEAVPEPPDLFRYIVEDFNGTTEEFQTKIFRELYDKDDGNDSLHVGWIVLIFALAGVGVLLVIIGVKKREDLPCAKYKAVSNPGLTGNAV